MKVGKKTEKYNQRYGKNRKSDILWQDKNAPREMTVGPKWTDA